MCQDLGSILFYEQVHICHCPVSCLPHLTICGSGAAAELGADKCGVFNQDKRMLSEIAPGLGWVDRAAHDSREENNTSFRYSGSLQLNTTETSIFLSPLRLHASDRICPIVKFVRRAGGAGVRGQISFYPASIRELNFVTCDGSGLTPVSVMTCDPSFIHYPG